MPQRVAELRNLLLLPYKSTPEVNKIKTKESTEEKQKFRVLIIYTETQFIYLRS